VGGKGTLAALQKGVVDVVAPGRAPLTSALRPAGKVAHSPPKLPFLDNKVIVNPSHLINALPKHVPEGHPPVAVAVAAAAAAARPAFHWPE